MTERKRKQTREERQKQQEQQDAQDHAVAAVAASIVALYLGYLTTRGITRGLGELSSEVAEGLLKPILVPFGLLTLAAMLPNGARETSNWRLAAERSADAAVKQVIEYAPTFEKKMEKLDVRAEDAQDVIQNMAETLVTTSTESLKSEVAPLMGFDSKKWLTRLDTRVRPAHAILQGAVIPISQPFQTIDGLLQYPGDRSAPIHLWINCRCSLEYVNALDEAA